MAPVRPEGEGVHRQPDRARRRARRSSPLGPALAACLACAPADAQDALLRRARTVLHEAIDFYRCRVAAHGGYVYHYSLDLARRWGEGRATRDQIWVQPPGTPTVGMAFLAAFEATGKEEYLDAAREAAEALVYGQLRSGGWTNCVDFDPRGERVARYRNGKGRGKDNSSLDDGQTQSAIRFLLRVDRALGFDNEEIHASVQLALDALLAAQFANGGFPQVWTGPVAEQPVLAASYPEYDWREQGRVKNYWDMYTLNDDVAGHVAATLIDAHRILGEDRFRDALVRLGDFLLLARMPDPQPAWAQQYGYHMHPVWARPFEPPAISGSESQDVLETLLRIHEHTGIGRFLEPVPDSLRYLERSSLPDGRLARFYELRTNRPLYVSRRGDEYTLTHDDGSLPGHYAWKVPSRLDRIRQEYDRLRRGQPRPSRSRTELAAEVRRIVRDLDGAGRWVSTYDEGRRLVGQPTLRPGERYISSAVFSRNVETLSDYLRAAR